MTLDMASIVAITSVFGLGISFALLGSVKLRLTEQLGIDDAQFGKLFSVFNFSNLVCVLIAGLLCDVLGFKTIAIVGYIVSGIAIVLFGQSKSLGTAMGACIMLGLGAMFMNTAGNTLLGNPEILYADPGRSGNFGNVFFGVGAFFIPIFIAYLCNKMSLGKVTTIIAIIVMLPVVFALIASFPEAAPGFTPADAIALAGNPVIIMCALTLMCYIALEVSMGGWISTYMSKGVGASDAKANQVLSIFWISIMLGRLTAALVIGNMIPLAEQGAMFICVLAVIATVVLFALTKVSSIGSATILIILTGLVFAPIFPTVVGLCFARIEPQFYGTGFSIIFAVGLAGAIFVPAWMGAISKGKNIKASMGVAAGTAAILIIMSLVMAFGLPDVLPPADAATAAVEAAIEAVTEVLPQ